MLVDRHFSQIRGTLALAIQAAASFFFAAAHRFNWVRLIFALVAAENVLFCSSASVVSPALASADLSQAGGLPLRLAPLPAASRVNVRIASSI